jgi:hypothetical protein
MGWCGLDWIDMAHNHIIHDSPATIRDEEHVCSIMKQGNDDPQWTPVKWLSPILGSERRQ